MEHLRELASLARTQGARNRMSSCTSRASAAASDASAAAHAGSAVESVMPVPSYTPFTFVGPRAHALPAVRLGTRKMHGLNKMPRADR